MLRQADQNRNGIIEPSEMQGRMGEFARRMAERAGLNPNGPLPIDRLTANFDQSRRDEGDRSRGDSDRDRDRDRDRSSSSGSGAAALPTDALLPFGSTTPIPKLPGFDVPLGAASQVPLEQRFDRRIMERAREMLRDRDDNRNGLLERGEWEGHRWDPPAEQSDVNKDSILTLEEIALRYQARESGSQSSSSRGPSPGGPPGTTGSRTIVSITPGNSPGASGGPQPGGDQTRFYAEGMIRRNDRNGDGRLQRDEWGSVREPESTDTNRDGVITVDEMAARLQSFGGGRMPFAGGPGGFGGPGDRGFGERGSGERGSGDRGSGERSFGDRGSSDRERGGERNSFSERGPGGPGSGERGGDRFSFGGRGSDSSGGSAPGSGDRNSFNSRRGSSPSGSSANSAPAPKRSYRLTTPTEQLPDGLPSWFKDSDSNGDGQISMPEYRRRSSLKENAEEFVKIDANGDGLITSQECLTYEGSSR
jgi:hypothetical protein